MGGSATNRAGIPFYIVDGYNVIFNARFSPGSGDIEDSRMRFLRLLQSYCLKKRVEIIVVWDGKGCAAPATGPLKSGKCRVAPGADSPITAVKSLYSNTGQSADERIVRLVERASDRARITVVSDDRRHIAPIVKHLGAKSMGVEEFLGLVGASKAGRKKAAVGAAGRKSEEGQKEKSAAGGLSVEEWLNLFRTRKE